MIETYTANNTRLFIELTMSKKKQTEKSDKTFYYLDSVFVHEWVTYTPNKPYEFSHELLRWIKRVMKVYTEAQYEEINDCGCKGKNLSKK